MNSWNRSQRIVKNPTSIAFKEDAIELAYLHQPTQTYPYQNLAYALWVTKFDIPNLRKIALYHKAGKNQTVAITLLKCSQWKELENIRQELHAKKVQRIQWKFDTMAEMMLIMFGLLIVSEADYDTTAFELGEAIGDLGEEIGTAKHDRIVRLEDETQNYLDK